MARAVASLAVSVVARTDKFRKGMKRAARILQKFGNSVRAMALKVAKFGSVLAGVAVGGLALFIKQSFASLDVLAKTSDKLGIQIDQLRGLERAAELTGGSIEQFRKSIIMMSKNISEAALGTGEALEAFEMLGITAEDLLGLSPDKALIKILRELDKVPGSIRRIGIAADIFGARSGTALLNLAALGPALESTIAQATRLFGKFSRIELNAVERANDALGDTFRSLRGSADRLAVTIAPMVERIAFLLTDSFVGFRRRLNSDILPALRKFFVQAANFAELFFLTLKVQIADIKIETLTTIAEVLAALRRDPIGILKVRERVKFRSLRDRDMLDFVTSGQVSGFGDRLAQAFDAFAEKGAAAFQKSQVDRATRQVKSFFAPILNAIRDPLSVFRLIVVDLNERLKPFKGKLRFKPPSVAEAVKIGQAQEIVLSRQALRAFPGQKREQIVKDRSVKAAIDSMHQTLKTQGNVAIVGR